MAVSRLLSESLAASRTLSISCYYRVYSTTVIFLPPQSPLPHPSLSFPPITSHHILHSSIYLFQTHTENQSKLFNFCDIRYISSFLIYNILYFLWFMPLIDLLPAEWIDNSASRDRHILKSQRERHWHSRYRNTSSNRSNGSERCWQWQCCWSRDGQWYFHTCRWS